ncbi:MAG: hypothetical protein E6G93_02785 [Alphaproteobacteria bacterium]|nr:MAG: hypothetical protein E6G93_02785 [Alphaproteobacteria bacterium]
MTATASPPTRPDRQTQRPMSPEAEARAAELLAANINPRTGLATDYLNHFNEAIMLLEMIPDMPECLAIEAYEAADARVRIEFDNIASAMTLILSAVGAAMREAHQDETRATLAGQAIGWVKPLVALAGGIINGGKEADIETIMASR